MAKASPVTLRILKYLGLTKPREAFASHYRTVQYKHNRAIFFVLGLVLMAYGFLNLLLMWIEPLEVRPMKDHYIGGFIALMSIGLVFLLLSRPDNMALAPWYKLAVLVLMSCGIYLNWVDLHHTMDLAAYLLSMLGLGLLFSTTPRTYLILYTGGLIVMLGIGIFLLPRPFNSQNILDIFLYTMVGLVSCLLQEAKRRSNEEMAQDLEHLNAQLKETSLRDPLTGLYNRRFLKEFTEKQLSAMRRSRLCMSVLMLDIDHFKRINDMLGHPAGDSVLKELSEILILGLRESDLVARFGGEEFVMVLPQTDLEHARQVAERLKTAIASNRFSMVPWSIGCSMGVTEAKAEETVDSLVSRVDLLLYEAKKTRDTVVTG